MIDKQIIFLRKWSVPALRVSLAIVYIWFGMLKVVSQTPVLDLVQALYPFLPVPEFIYILGAWEVLIGIGLLVPRLVWPAVLLLLLQMGGIMIGLFVNPPLFFEGNNPLLLNLNGEFLIKNLVLIAASLVVATHDKEHRSKYE